VQANIGKWYKSNCIKIRRGDKMEICELEKKDERAWDEYIFKSEQRTL
jgi:hypothetical protein